MITFLIHSGKHSGKILNLTGNQILVGRDDGCQIRLSTSDVSRKHCLMTQKEAHWTIRDLGSQNGTFVNDSEVKGEQTLQPGDQLRVGPMVLIYSPPDTEGTPTATGRQAKKQPVVDDDIASWLTDDNKSASSSGDTTIISAPQTPAANSGEADTASEVEIVAGPKASSKTFLTVADEAADIIRRHWEAVNAEESSDGIHD